MQFSRRVSMLNWLIVSGGLLAVGIGCVYADGLKNLPEGSDSYFHTAKPIWPVGRETEMNLSVGFRAVFEAPVNKRATLRITGSSLYRIYLNGEFLGHGPARAGHGYYRVDEIELGGRLIEGVNVIAVEVAGYNINSYYLLDQPAFLQAEIVSEGKVLVSTGGEGVCLKAIVLDHRVQKVQRYSFQRTFIEYYRLKPGFDGWLLRDYQKQSGVKVGVLPVREFLPRRVPCSNFYKRSPLVSYSEGKIERAQNPKELWKGRALRKISDELKGYKESELEVIPSLDLQKIRFVDAQGLNTSYSSTDPILLGDNSWRILDFGRNLSGFIGATLCCKKPTKLYLIFDEILSENDVNFRRMGCVNIITYELDPGTYKVETIEPYTLRYLKLLVYDGECSFSGLYLREYVNPHAERGEFACSDLHLMRIFEAARKTFKQNATDIFMDCPSRERAGWLCDSFFTSRVALDLCGETTVEKNFLENFLLPPSFTHLPQGMLPMCYPADHYDGVFIPNWAMWFVIQLEEYLQRTGDEALVKALEPKVMALLEYLKQFENEDGLLEKLESWIFIEWSAANKFVKDVNYPSNMLYGAVLATAGRLYGSNEMVEKARKIRQNIYKQSFDGEFFVDNALRKDGKLEITRNRSECCQYFAFYFGLASPDQHPKLWNNLVTQFGPLRDEKKVFPEIYKANAFIGNYIRLELLSRYGLTREIQNELADFYYPMAVQTGTLWENIHSYASCNHGFASHVAHSLYRDLLGIYHLDPVRKKITLRFCNNNLDWCNGSVPTPDGFINLRWQKKDGKISYHAEYPAGYQLETKTIGELEVTRE